MKAVDNTVTPGHMWREQRFTDGTTQRSDTYWVLRSRAKYFSSSPLIRGNRDSPLPHSYRRVVDVACEGSLTTYRPDGTYTKYVGSGWTVESAGILNTWTRHIASIDDDAYSQAVRNAYDRLAGLDLTTSAIELAREGVKKPAKELVSVAHEALGLDDPYGRDLSRPKYRKGLGYVRYRYQKKHPRAPERVANVLKRSGKVWLINAYVVQPLLGDIFKSALQLQSKLEDQTYKVYGAGSSKGRPVVIRPSSQITGAQENWNGTIESKCRCKLTFRIPQNHHHAAQLLSMDPVRIGWNLIPFSFVVDWFYDIGGWLGQLEASAMYSAFFKHGYVSQLSLISVDSSLSSPKGPWVGSFNGGRYNSVAFKRTPLYSIPRVPKPKANIDLGSRTLLNAAALLAQLLR